MRACDVCHVLHAYPSRRTRLFRYSTGTTSAVFTPCVVVVVVVGGKARC